MINFSKSKFTIFMKTMPKPKKRNATERSQIRHVYAPILRLRKHQLPPFEMQLMTDAFLFNKDVDWTLTSNCKIINDGANYYIRVLHRKLATIKKGVRRTSCKYDSIIDAENNAFDYRISLESKKSKENINRYKEKLCSLLEPQTLQTPLLLHEAPKATKDDKTPRKKQKRQLSPFLQRQYSMSSSATLNQKTNSSTNPMNNPCHIDFDINSAYSIKCASKIQRWVSNTDVKRAAKKLKETIANQSYRQSLIRYLSKYLCNDTCEYLLLGSEDTEILASFTPFDRKHVTMKARHVTDALRELVAATISNTPITWLECCEKAIEINFKTIKRARTIADWYLELHKSKKLQFRRSKRGKDSHFALSPFAEDESLTVQLKSWARQDIEHMTVSKTQGFINTKLLMDWTAEQFSTYKISFPVSESVTARWIKEAGFKYEQH